ncbi:hypothetical protein N22_007 [Idiomarinaceae phage 1N2-2]|uniref:hypothetical protein n=1 Tax=Idiomarinaceae phage 1N2-2 TaxID=1536592 RepID=UPI0004F76524|nr:hypothetical protein N22_007 [Idiomarinaceae phage 1N2-2]AIM40709.1 hypothetical protein N22_007 [Idiomarinaceae phage 1N2-2]
MVKGKIYAKVECRMPSRLIITKWKCTAIMMAVMGKDYEAYLINRISDWAARNTTVSVHA